MAISEIKNNKFRLDLRVRKDNGLFGRFRKVADSMQEALETESIVKGLIAQGMTEESIKLYFKKGSTDFHNEGVRTLKDLLELTINNRWKDKPSQIKNAHLILNLLGEDYPISKINKNTFNDLIDDSLDKGNSEATVNRKISALLTMLKEGAESDWLQHSTIPRVKRYAEKNSNPNWLDKETVRKVVDHCRAAGKHQHADLVEFLVQTGLRISEALATKSGSVRVLSKVADGHSPYVLTVDMADSSTKRHHRVIPLTVRAYEIYDKYVTGLADGINIFPIKYTSFENTWNTTVRSNMGWQRGDHFSIHVLRHTFASLALQNGVSVEQLQQILGHKTITVTQRYAKSSTTHLQAALPMIELALNY